MTVTMTLEDRARKLKKLLEDDNIRLTVEDCQDLIIADFVTNTLLSKVDTVSA